MAHSPWKKLAGITAVSVGSVFVFAQLVPYGRRHTNPPVRAEPPWDSSMTRILAQRACFDCHSNETRWPWYSHVAPSSWLLQSHVDEGREALNFSEFSTTFEDAHEAGDAVRDRSMPPRTYLWMHPEARLSAAERQQLAAGLDATLRGVQTRNED